MWSTGVILYILLCGFPPFYEEELPALFDQILHARYDFPSPWWDSISKEAKSLVQALLTLDPKKRMTADEVLKQPWVTGAASDAPLDSVQKSLRKYNATRKLKKAALGIMAQQRMTKALEGLALGPK
jgi:serine/threonine protein kinase